jgi:membrane protease YdiL (CAAX protease family)
MTFDVHFFGYGTFATARLLKTWEPDRNLLLIPSQHIFWLGMVLLCLFLGWLSGLSYQQLGWYIPSPWFQIGGGMIIGLGLGALFFYATLWVLRYSGHQFYSAFTLKHVVPDTPQELKLVLLAIIPGVIFEELLFRSLLLGGVSPILPIPILLIGGSIIFGLFHSSQGKWGMVGATLAGLIFGVIFLWQGSILMPIIIHYVVNAFQLKQGMSYKKDLL